MHINSMMTIQNIRRERYALEKACALMGANIIAVTQSTVCLTHQKFNSTFYCCVSIRRRRTITDLCRLRRSIFDHNRLDGFAESNRYRCAVSTLPRRGPHISAGKFMRRLSHKSQTPPYWPSVFAHWSACNPNCKLHGTPIS